MAYGKFLIRSRAKSASKRGPYSRAGGSSRVYRRRNYGASTKSVTRYPAMYNPVPARLHNVVAPRFFTNLEYGFTGFIDVAAASATWNIFANGLLNPGDGVQDFTAIGTVLPATVALSALDPAGFGELLGLYRAYRVWSSSTSVTVCPAAIAVNTSQGKLLVCLPTTTATSLAESQQMQSLPYAKAIMVSSGASTKDNSIHHYMDMKTLFGLSSAQLQGDPGFVGTAAANPTNTAYWQYNVRDLIGTNLSAGATNMCTVLIRVSYHVEFYSPDNLLTVAA